MAVISGEGGSVNITGSSGFVKSWTLSYVGDVLDTTNFDTTGGREYIAGLTNWSGSFEGFYSTGNTKVPGDTGTLVMKRSGTTGEGWEGSIIITGMDVSTPRDGLVTQSYTFQGTGALSASTV